MAKATATPVVIREIQDTKSPLEVKGDALAFQPPFCHKKASARTAFFPAQFRQARKRRCVMRRLLHVLETVAIYALKRLIDWLFDSSKN